eukprot:g80802.t1
MMMTMVVMMRIVMVGDLQCELMFFPEKIVHLIFSSPAPKNLIMKFVMINIKTWKLQPTTKYIAVRDSAGPNDTTRDLTRYSHDIDESDAQMHAYARYDKYLVQLQLKYHSFFTYLAAPYHADISSRAKVSKLQKYVFSSSLDVAQLR